ncbi:alpha/beta hydrolase family protein [Streptomyces sp. NRRL F-5053]|uniref:alpha/beta hydrolase family protein n=1 Tax=Streptomyces sp. NRRL F-5053 TaxID=1463854 RepID=UPI00069214A5|nr:alpha/beta fold hydrolase [Streptomyces sp. NRRL F-5053]
MRNIEMTAAADDGLPLAGTLTLPEGTGPHPAVILLHGSGRLDRDGNTAKVRMELGPPLAAALAAEGIATFRYDRRGVAATPGDWTATGFADNQADAAATIRALAAHPEIRPDALGVVGHSEGAVHAMTLGSHPRVKAVVLLAGFAGRGDDALRWQGRQIAGGLPAPLRSLLRSVGNRHIARMKRTRTDVARVAGVRMNARWSREMFLHDSRPDLSAIRVPTLAITGAKDIQVDPADLDEMRRLVPGEIETHHLPDLTHLLRRDPGRPSLRTYRRLLRAPVDAELLAQVSGWLAPRLREAGPRLQAVEQTGTA